MSDDNNISTEGIIEERRKKLELLREENRAYLNNFSKNNNANEIHKSCLLYTSPSPRDAHESRMPSSA